MKFSILLPTRNRLELLRQAVHTVLKQDCEDWELIISDNASSEDIGGYVESLRDIRIKYSRSPTFLSVTQNWNRAIGASCGDYVLMLGDDDGLLPGALRKLASVVENWSEPELVFMDALLFAYPNVLPDAPRGFLRRQRSAFFEHIERPSPLARDRAHQLVLQAMRFELPFPFNAQYYLISATLVARVKRKGPFYQSPYPDFYAALAVMLESASTVIYPSAPVVIGISPRSFGFFFFNKRESEGTVFLNNAEDVNPEVANNLRSILLPTDHDTSWLIALETVRSNFASELEGEVNYEGYRAKQLADAFFGAVRTRGSLQMLWEVISKMPPRELAIIGADVLFRQWPKRLIPSRLKPALRRLLGRPTPSATWHWSRTGFSSMMDVFERIDTAVLEGKETV